MKKTAKIIIALLMLTLLVPVQASAQYLAKKLDARDGLTSSQINCILKDDKGYMWFGTPAGLYRYDGYTFKHFQSDSQDGFSLPDSYIESIQISLAGDLWIKTAAGYCIYHPQTEIFERDLRQVFAQLGMKTMPEIIFQDRKRNLWGYQPNKGVFCFDIQQQLLFEFGYTNDSNGIPQGKICSIGECNDGAVLVYDDGLLVCCNVIGQQHRVVWINKEIAQHGLRQSKTLKVYADRQDNIWLYGQGTLLVYEKEKRFWDTHFGDELGLTSTQVDLAVNGVYGDNKNVWVATDRYGLMRIDINTHHIEQVTLTSMSPFYRMPEEMSVNCVYVDNSGLLWVGSNKNGVVFVGNSIYKFQSDFIGDITAMTQDASGKMYYGTSDKGLVDSDVQLVSRKVTAMAISGDSSLWVGSQQNGLTRIKNERPQFYTSNDPNVRRRLIDNHINALCTDKSGNLWIATEGGLQMYNTKMEQFSNYTKESGKLRNNNITALHYASGNRLLIGTAEGVAIMSISTAEMVYLTGSQVSGKKFTNNFITQIFEDSRGLIWVGTREGVNILDLENDNLDYLTEKIGLCNNNICGITEDKNHNVWITTSNGVCRIVIQRDHVDGSFNYGLYNYDHNDGLQSNEFNLGAIITRKDGEVMMGGLYGINWVRAKAPGDVETLPSVMLTQLFVGEEEILTGHEYNGHVTLTSALNETNTLKLKKNQNTFTIKFAGGNYNQSERLQFMYWMEGLDDDWKNGDALKHCVTFTDLPSKSYKLHVKAMSPDGAISDQERVITIVIERPWYLQWWMLIVYASFLAFAIYLWRKGWKQMSIFWLKKKAIIRELTVQKEEIKAASDDLRQPMSRMTTIIMNLAELDSSPEEREQLNALHSQMLQVITRVSDMQTALEHPEEKAKQNVNNNYQLISHGEMILSNDDEEELTSEIVPRQSDLPTSKFRVIFIDDNAEFIKFISNRLKHIYDFHSYDNIFKAQADIESMQPDLVICKQNMPNMSGSELCNAIKMNHKLNRVKFVLTTDMKLTANEMANQNITMAADDYLAKPFNMQDAVMRFNKLMGIGPITFDSHLIEGAETRMLEDRNSSMTTATETLNYDSINRQIDIDEQMKAVSINIRSNYSDTSQEKTIGFELQNDEFNMNYNIDRQLIKSIEQYVQQNMSRGTINLEEMAAAMGMGMKPFFQKVRDITGKTPAEVVRDLRLKHACVLLQLTNINMSELATNIGFPTADHFINMFKERFGISPSEYRLKYRK